VQNNYLAMKLLALMFVSASASSNAQPQLDPAVEDFLRALNLTHHAGSFTEHDIDHELLMLMREQDLVKIGITSWGATKKIMASIRELNPTAADLFCEGCAYGPPWQIFFYGSTQPYSQLTDVNGDGLPDWIVADGEGVGYYATYLNTGKGWCINYESASSKGNRIAARGADDLMNCTAVRT
jgi:hypothetical protein